MAENVGSIEYDARINTGNFYSDASKVEDRAGSMADNIEKTGGKSFASFSNKASSAFGGVADSLEKLAKVATGLFIGGAFGVGAFVKQASELQSLRASFESMTGSAEAANSVMQQLNKFSFETAFSTLDINKAAQLLLGAGVATADLGKYMKQIGDIAGATGADLGQLTLPLSQALARGKLQTQDFYQILNSGAGTFRKVLEDEVIKRGLGNLQDAMAAGTVTSEVLTAALEKSNAAGGFAFDGAIKQSKTFAGQMSNLQETIGNVALKVLGVDKATGNIDPNGIFAKLSKSVESATKWLNENQESIQKVANTLIQNAVPAVGALAAAFITAKTAALGFGIIDSITKSIQAYQAATLAAAKANTTLSIAQRAAFFANPIAAIITAVVAALVFLQLKFDIFGKALDWVTKQWQTFKQWASDAITTVSNLLTTVKDTVMGAVSTAVDGIGTAFTRLMDTAKAVFDAITGWLYDWRYWIQNVSIVIGTLLLPKLTAIGIEAAKAAGSAIASFVSMSASAVKEGAITSASWAKSAALSSAAFIKSIPSMIKTFVLSSAAAVKNAAITTAAWVASSVKTLAAWALASAGYLLQVGAMVLATAGAALSMAASWLLAMGPIGLIVAAIIGLTALIIANWDTVKGWLTGFWDWLKDKFTDALDFVKRNWQTILAILTGPIGLAVLLIARNFDTLKQAFSNVKDWITSIFAKVGDLAANAFKGVVNSVISTAESTVNGFIRAINGAIGAINKIPGVNIGKLGELNIPRLAEGGIVQPRPGGVLANIAEAGQAEAVIPLDKLDDMLTTNSRGGGANITINLSGIMTRSKADEREIARSLIQTINDELRAKGMQQIGGGAV
jgi:tape measure domain-containing protein